MTEQEAGEIAKHWVDAWNRHDLEAILAHYAEEVEFTSPYMMKLLDGSSGTLKGKGALRSYFARGLAAYPDLQFELIEAWAGVQSLVVSYRNVKRGVLAAEMMVMNPEGEVIRGIAHYHAS